MTATALAPTAAPTMPATRATGRRRTIAVITVVLLVALLLRLVVAGTGRRMLVVTRPVAAGATVTADDLTTVTAARGGAPLIGASHRDRVVGRVAAVDLVPGTLLVPEMLTDRAVPGPGEAVIAVSRPTAALPYSLDVGATVRLIGAGDDPAATVDTTGRVLDIDVDPETATARLSVLVADGDAAAVARAAAADLLTVALVTRGTR